MTMAIDECLVERIRKALDELKVVYYEKRMMGGLVFMINDKMACGVHFMKGYDEQMLMARIGAEAAKVVCQSEGCRQMEMKGRVMKDYVLIAPEAYDFDENLKHWIQLSLA